MSVVTNWIWTWNEDALPDDIRSDGVALLKLLNDALIDANEHGGRPQFIDASQAQRDAPVGPKSMEAIVFVGASDHWNVHALIDFMILRLPEDHIVRRASVVFAQGEDQDRFYQVWGAQEDKCKTSR